MKMRWVLVGAAALALSCTSDNHRAKPTTTSSAPTTTVEEGQFLGGMCSQTQFSATQGQRVDAPAPGDTPTIPAQDAVAISRRDTIASFSSLQTLTVFARWTDPPSVDHRPVWIVIALDAPFPLVGGPSSGPPPSVPKTAPLLTFIDANTGAELGTEYCSA